MSNRERRAAGSDIRGVYGVKVKSNAKWLSNVAGAHTIKPVLLAFPMFTPLAIFTGAIVKSLN